MTMELAVDSTGPYTEIVRDEHLPNPSYFPCKEIPLLRYEMTSFTYGRYVKFNVLSYETNGAVIQHIEFDRGKL